MFVELEDSLTQGAAVLTVSHPVSCPLKLLVLRNKHKKLNHETANSTVYKVQLNTRLKNMAQTYRCGLLFY